MITKTRRSRCLTGKKKKNIIFYFLKNMPLRTMSLCEKELFRPISSNTICHGAVVFFEKINQNVENYFLPAHKIQKQLTTNDLEANNIKIEVAKFSR